MVLIFWLNGFFHDKSSKQFLPEHFSVFLLGFFDKISKKVDRIKLTKIVNCLNSYEDCSLENIFEDNILIVISISIASQFRWYRTQSAATGKHLQNIQAISLGQITASHLSSRDLLWQRLLRYFSDFSQRERKVQNFVRKWYWWQFIHIKTFIYLSLFFLLNLSSSAFKIKTILS